MSIKNHILWHYQNRSLLPLQQWLIGQSILVSKKEISQKKEKLRGTFHHAGRFFQKMFEKIRANHLLLLTLYWKFSVEIAECYET